jgi:hypothetical protein
LLQAPALLVNFGPCALHGRLVLTLSPAFRLAPIALICYRKVGIERRLGRAFVGGKSFVFQLVLPKLNIHLPLLFLHILQRLHLFLQPLLFALATGFQFRQAALFRLLVGNALALDLLAPLLLSNLPVNAAGDGNQYSDQPCKG